MARNYGFTKAEFDLNINCDSASSHGTPPIHLGEHLAEQLKKLGMSAAELCRRLKIPTNRITGILNGQRAITGDSAVRLAHVFGTSADFWLNLQKLYGLRLAEAKAGASIRRLESLGGRERSDARKVNAHAD